MGQEGRSPDKKRQDEDDRREDGKWGCVVPENIHTPPTEGFSV